MLIPEKLKEGIESLTASMDLKGLIEGRQDLSERYRSPEGKKQLMASEAHRQSYLISRMPATYSAIRKCFQWIQERGDFPIKSLLDLGAGPGTGIWAAADAFNALENATLIEQDNALISLGKQLAAFSDHPVFQKAKWCVDNIEILESLENHDCLLFSYSIGELGNMENILKLAFEKATQLLVVIEPGTPAGFERIRLIRSRLIDMGAHLIAPCPHHNACPMKDGDWCHFSVRLERTSLHRRLKGGTLGYEDEKFSYVAATKTLHPLPASRILATPDRHSGHIRLKLCTAEGVKYPIISKKMGKDYKEARKADWGDVYS